MSGTGGAGVWVDDHGTAPHFAGNHVSASGLAGILVSDGAGGDFEANDLRGNAGGSWKLDAPGELRRSGNLEDARHPAGGRRGADPPAGPRPAPGELSMGDDDHDPFDLGQLLFGYLVYREIRDGRLDADQVIRAGCLVILLIGAVLGGGALLVGTFAAPHDGGSYVPFETPFTYPTEQPAFVAPAP